MNVYNVYMTLSLALSSLQIFLVIWYWYLVLVLIGIWRLLFRIASIVSWRFR